MDSTLLVFGYLVIFMLEMCWSQNRDIIPAICHDGGHIKRISFKEWESILKYFRYQRNRSMIPLMGTTLIMKPDKENSKDKIPIKLSAVIKNSSLIDKSALLAGIQEFFENEKGHSIYGYYVFYDALLSLKEIRHVKIIENIYNVMLNDDIFKRALNKDKLILLRMVLSVFDHSSSHGMVIPVYLEILTILEDEINNISMNSHYNYIFEYIYGLKMVSNNNKKIIQLFKKYIQIQYSHGIRFNQYMFLHYFKIQKKYDFRDDYFRYYFNRLLSDIETYVPIIYDVLAILNIEHEYTKNVNHGDVAILCHYIVHEYWEILLKWSKDNVDRQKLGAFNPVTEIPTPFPAFKEHTKSDLENEYCVITFCLKYGHFPHYYNLLNDLVTLDPKRVKPLIVNFIIISTLHYISTKQWNPLSSAFITYTNNLLYLIDQFKRRHPSAYPLLGTEHYLHLINVRLNAYFREKLTVIASSSFQNPIQLIFIMNQLMRRRSNINPVLTRVGTSYQDVPIQEYFGWIKVRNWDHILMTDVFKYYDVSVKEHSKCEVSQLIIVFEKIYKRRLLPQEMNTILVAFKITSY